MIVYNIYGGGERRKREPRIDGEGEGDVSGCIK